MTPTIPWAFFSQSQKTYASYHPDNLNSVMSKFEAANLMTKESMKNTFKASN